MNGKKPPDDLDLRPWIKTGSPSSPQPSSTARGHPDDEGASAPGIVVIGFQEVVPLSAGNVLAGSALTNIKAWDRLIAVELNGAEWSVAIGLHRAVLPSGHESHGNAFDASGPATT